MIVSSAIFFNIYIYIYMYVFVRVCVVFESIERNQFEIGTVMCLKKSV